MLGADKGRFLVNEALDLLNTLVSLSNVRIKLLEFCLLHAVLLSLGAGQFLQPVDFLDELCALLLNTIDLTSQSLKLLAEFVES